MSGKSKEWLSPDGCVRKIILKSGIWGEVPRDGSQCRISITKVEMLEGFPRNPEEEEALVNSLYFSPTVSNIPETLVLGEADSDLDRILETCVHSMLPQEECSAVFFFRSREKDKEDPETPESNPAPAVKLCITLLEYEHVPHHYMWSDEKKYAEASRHRMAGVALFGQRRVVDAFLRFSKAVRLLIYIVMDSEETEKRVCQLRGALYANMATCQLRRGNYFRADELCTRALSLEESNVKVLYRRGVARTHLQEFELACEDLEKARTLEPKNEAVRKALVDVKKRMKVLNARYGAAVKKALNLW